MIINSKGVRFIEAHSRPLEIDSLDRAQEVLATAIAKGPASDKITPEQWARHLAWIIGFDDLVKDRKTVFQFVEKLAGN